MGKDGDDVVLVRNTPSAGPCQRPPHNVDTQILHSSARQKVSFSACRLGQLPLKVSSSCCALLDAVSCLPALGPRLSSAQMPERPERRGGSLTHCGAQIQRPAGPFYSDADGCAQPRELAVVYAAVV